MKQQAIILRKTPFWFLKWLVVIEFFFAILPFALAVLFRAWETYNATPVADAVPYTVLAALIIAFLQVLILTLTFLVWYLPAYHIDAHRIVHRRANLFEDRSLTHTQQIAAIEVERGVLARRLGYGTLAIHSAEKTETVYVRNISMPDHYAEMILEMVDHDARTGSAPEFASVDGLIAGGESQFVEFKSSLMWDYRQQRINKDLYEPVMKNVVAFLNSMGGTLLIGVDDDGEILGLEPDYRAIKKQNADGFENVFSMAFNKMVGVEFRRFLDVTFPEMAGKQVCVISVRPAPQPAYLSFHGQETFYVRAGNATQPLSVSKAARYIRDRFSGD